MKSRGQLTFRIQLFFAIGGLSSGLIDFSLKLKYDKRLMSGCQQATKEVTIIGHRSHMPVVDRSSEECYICSVENFYSANE